MGISHIDRALFQTLSYHRMVEILKYHRGGKLLDIVLDGLLLLSDVHQVRITGGALHEQREGLLVDSGN